MDQLLLAVELSSHSSKSASPTPATCATTPPSSSLQAHIKAERTSPAPIQASLGVPTSPAFDRTTEQHPYMAAAKSPSLGDSSELESASAPVASEKRRRYRIPREDLEGLKEIFETNPRPSHEQLLALSVKLSIDLHKVKIWFQNMRQRKNFNHSHEPAHQQRLLNSSRGEQPANPEKSASDQGTSSLSPAESNVSIHPKFLQFHPAFHVETGGSFQPQQLQELQRQQHVSPLQRQLPPLSAPGSPPKPMPTLPPLSMAAAGLNASPILPPPVAIQAQQEFHQNRNPYQHTPGQQQTPRSFMEHEYHQSHSRIHHVQAVTDYQQCQNQPQYHHATAGSSSYGDSRYGTYTGNNSHNSQLPFPSVQHSQHISTGVSVSPYPSSQPKQDHVRSQLLSSGPQFHHSSSHSDPTHSMQHVYHQQPSSNQQNQPYQTHLPYPSHLPNPCPQLQQQQYQHQHQGALRYQPDPPRFDSRHHQHPHHNPYQSSMTSTSTQNNVGGTPNYAYPQSDPAAYPPNPTPSSTTSPTTPVALRSDLLRASSLRRSDGSAEEDDGGAGGGEYNEDEDEDAGSSALRPGNKKGSKRFIMSRDHLKWMKKIFEDTPFPSSEQMGFIGETVGMDKRQVRVWFQNRRAVLKRKQQAASKATAADGAGAV